MRVEGVGGSGTRVEGIGGDRQNWSCKQCVTTCVIPLLMCHKRDSTRNVSQT